MVVERRPYLVALITLDAEDAPAFAEQHGCRRGTAAVEPMRRGAGGGGRGQLQGGPGRADQEVHAVLPKDLAQETGELDPHAQGQAQRGQREERRRDRELYARVTALADEPTGADSLTSSPMAGSNPSDTGRALVGPRPGRRPRAPAGRRCESERAPSAPIAAWPRDPRRWRRSWRVSLFGPQPAAWLWIGSTRSSTHRRRRARLRHIIVGCLARWMPRPSPWPSGSTPRMEAHPPCGRLSPGARRDRVDLRRQRRRGRRLCSVSRSS